MRALPLIFSAEPGEAPTPNAAVMADMVVFDICKNAAAVGHVLLLCVASCVQVAPCMWHIVVNEDAPHGKAPVATTQTDNIYTTHQHNAQPVWHRLAVFQHYAYCPSVAAMHIPCSLSDRDNSAPVPRPPTRSTASKCTVAQNFQVERVSAPQKLWLELTARQHCGGVGAAAAAAAARLPKTGV